MAVTHDSEVLGAQEARMPIELTDEELLELYEVLNGCQRVLKHQEQARAGLDLLEKPAPYSPLVERLMAIRGLVGEKVAVVHASQQQQ